MEYSKNTSQCKHHPHKPSKWRTLGTISQMTYACSYLAGQCTRTRISWTWYTRHRDAFKRDKKQHPVIKRSGSEKNLVSAYYTLQNLTMIEMEFTTCNALNNFSSQPGRGGYNSKYGAQTRGYQRSSNFVPAQIQGSGTRNLSNANNGDQPALATNFGYNQTPIYIPRGNRPCFKCGIPGHTFDVCENPRQDVCNICHAFGHTRLNCSLRKTGVATSFQVTNQLRDNSLVESIDTQESTREKNK